MLRIRFARPLVAFLVVVAVASVGYDMAKDSIRSVYAARMPRPTPFPASTQPDQVCLTWSGDPQTTQTIQWRASTDVADGIVQYRKSADSTAAPAETAALMKTFTDERIENNPSVNRFYGTLTGLEPGGAYEYRVGNKQTDKWTEWTSFTTAPLTAQSFSFLYFGDVQIGFPTWNKLVDAATQNTPQAAFVLTAGDQVNRGNYRNEWDGFFNAGAALLSRRPLVPTIGNHECPHGADPQLYLDTFALLENGPQSVPKERAYSFRYSNALFVVLDSNLEADDQAPWLEQLLSTSNDTWKFVLYHHPAYSSSAHRDNDEVREQWATLFDKYHVDVAFQGHDHAYLRSKPMKEESIVASAAEGTYYVLSVAGTKFYDPGSFDYAELIMADTPTWQAIDIETGAVEKLTYRSYDLEGKLRDQFTIEKAPVAPKQ